jgi:hypothetical protein
MFLVLKTIACRGDRSVASTLPFALASGNESRYSRLRLHDRPCAEEQHLTVHRSSHKAPLSPAYSQTSSHHYQYLYPQSHHLHLLRQLRLQKLYCIRASVAAAVSLLYIRPESTQTTAHNVGSGYKTLSNLIIAYTSKTQNQPFVVNSLLLCISYLGASLLTFGLDFRFNFTSAFNLEPSRLTFPASAPSTNVKPQFLGEHPSNCFIFFDLSSSPSRLINDHQKQSIPNFYTTPFWLDSFQFYL